MQPTLEVPIDSIAAAEAAGPLADRLEVCSDLASEGWSPDPWLIREIRSRTRCQIVAMIRPRADHAIESLRAEAFRCTPRLLEQCLREIDALARAGADSVAIGPLDGSRSIDHQACERMLHAARGRGMSVSFLRTFDLIDDRERAARDVAALGFDRLLTAGIQGWDASSRSLSERMHEVARTIAIIQSEAARLRRPPPAVMPCGGVRATNAAAWLTITPHLHASCRTGSSLDARELQALHSVLRPMRP